MKLKKAILHSIGNGNGTCILSDTELDIESETCEAFITKHVKKLLNNPASKEATFNADSEVNSYICGLKDGSLYFKSACQRIGKRLSNIMAHNPSIPGGDLLIVMFEDKKQDYIAILKLNYREVFTHEIKRGPGGADNQIVKYPIVLPFDSGKVEEAVLIPYDPMVLKVLEKPFEIDGEQKNYFSEMFLECQPELSKKETADMLKEISEEISSRYFDNSVEASAKIKTALIEQAAEAEGDISVEGVAAKAFGDNLEIRDSYVGLARDAGLRHDMPLGEKFVRQQFGIQRIKASNGIEVKFPAELWGDGCIEMLRQPDGTASILLKNVGEVEAC
ncbi:MAG: nucleoid-associated protein [Clostridiales bacterium]|jgi:hypothetical protein|nr:nucleoid-associated protein [Clostridiales bacterium]